ncbi:cytochrome c oxidase subunit 3 family protein [Labrenzia sp. 011]|uniref:cytochrome c oxidase subunit 3 family protein n=1 Tax=Labrenzia sp. 011 TaxID=2171494 RepID=UPI00269AED6D
MDDGPENASANALETLPGDLMMWVLIVSELLVFGAGLAAFLSVRITDPSGFSLAQARLSPTAAGINTIVLITSGFLAARALNLRLLAQRSAARWHLVAAIGLGAIFMALKIDEYMEKAGEGISTETHPFFTFYYLLTGFHAAHVLAGMVILALVAWKDDPGDMEAGTAFWHMVDLVWVLLFPVIYLLG